MATKRPVNVGLIGLGRLGKVYVRDLSARVSSARLVAVADTNTHLAKQTAEEFGVPRWYETPLDLIDDKAVEAVVIVTPTHTHKEIVCAAAERQKAIFCEKPLSLSLDDAFAMKKAVARAGVFFQMGFMRRFDPGYAAAKKKIEEGAIGKPVIFRATSRDPFRPSLEYANPKSSGGLIIDMGIHDIDLARWFMGEIKTTYAIGGVLAYPEMKTVGDIDNAIVSLTFADGRLGVIDLSRNAVYGYDVTTEIVGTAGALKVGHLQETPLLVMTKNNVAHDVVPSFVERFAEAYTVQLQNFADNLLHDRPPAITIDDGIAALRVAIAATRAYQGGKAVEVASITRESD